MKILTRAPTQGRKFGMRWLKSSLTVLGPSPTASQLDPSDKLDTPLDGSGNESPQSNDQSIPFRHQKIVIAMDTSTSTRRAVFAKETAFVASISNLMSPEAEKIQVLPWNGTADTPVTVSRGANELNAVETHYGTDPRVLHYGRQLDILKSSGLWFLLTDGMITDSVVQSFALGTAAHRLHGHPCVIIVFGKTSWGPPAACDVSVGIAVSAVTPNCALLFYDVGTGSLYSLHCKGCFTDLLSNTKPQSMLQPYTSWDDLPRVSIENFAKLSVPAPLELLHDDIAFQGRLKVNLPQLYSDNVSQAGVDEILHNDENLKSLVLAEMTRGMGTELQGWLQKQYREKPTLSQERPDICGKAQKAVIDLLDCLNGRVSRTRTAHLRQALRRAHEENLVKFHAMISHHQQKQTEVEGHNERIKWASSMSYDIQERSCNGNESSYAAAHVSSQSSSGDYYDERYEAYWPSGTISSTKSQLVKELFFPGFEKGDGVDGTGFVGQCALCERDSVLSILFKTPPELMTPGLPGIGSQSRLAFPLAMGNFAEVDVLSFYVCCDACALYLVKNQVSPYNETIVDAIPLVPFVANKTSWYAVVAGALRGRFNVEDLPCVFLAMLDRMIMENKDRSKSTHTETFEKAARWAMRDVLQATQVPLELSLSFLASLDEGSTDLSSIIRDARKIDPIREDNQEIILLRYPVSGYAVLSRLIRQYGLSSTKLPELTLYRLLYHLAETHFRHIATEGVETATRSLVDLITEEDLNTTFTINRTTNCRNVANIGIDKLQISPLLEEHILGIFKTLEEFKVIEKNKAGPVIAVFLHRLCKLAPHHGSPVDVFNVIKTETTTGGILALPFDVSEETAERLVL